MRRRWQCHDDGVTVAYGPTLDHDSHDPRSSDDRALLISADHGGKQSRLELVDLFAGVPKAGDGEERLVANAEGRTDGQREHVKPNGGDVLAEVACGHVEACRGELIEQFGVDQVNLAQVRLGGIGGNAGSVLDGAACVSVSLDSYAGNDVDHVEPPLGERVQRTGVHRLDCGILFQMTLHVDTEFRTGGVLAQLADRLNGLPAAESRLALEILRSPALMVRSSIGEFSDRAGSSPATAVRLARRLGHEGFAALKLEVAADVGRADQFGHSIASTGDHPLDRTVESHHQALEAMRSSVDRGHFDRTVEVIASCRRLLIVGAGGSSAIAHFGAFRLLALGVDASAEADLLTARIAAGNLGKEGVCLCVSHTGETTEVVEIAEVARRSSATTVALTSMARSALVDVADLALVTGRGAPPATLELIADRVTHLAVLAALHLAIGQHRTPSSGAAQAIASKQR